MFETAGKEWLLISLEWNRHFLILKPDLYEGDTHPLVLNLLN